MNKKVEELLSKGYITKENLKTDSRSVKQGDIFVAIKGVSNDGNVYIREAIDRGARFIVSEEDRINDSDKIINVRDVRDTLGKIAEKLYCDPTKFLSVFGVTGTNGKTTTVFMIDRILNTALVESGVIGTVFTKTRGDVLEPSCLTTPDVITLNRLLSEMVSSGKKAAAIEVSSHALDQKRISGIKLDAAVFTNITPEHLDYHKDMLTYLRDKSKIFNYLKKDGVCILNVDDPMIIGTIESINPASLITFGIKNPALVTAENISLSVRGSQFMLVVDGVGSVKIKSKLVGEHNVYNMLAAAAAVIRKGISLEMVARGLEELTSVPGRLEKIVSEAPFSVYVDYAHTPNALENVLMCLRSLTRGKLICVFGCGGDRDKTKRSVMGTISSENCDRVIITNDNPRTEDPESILKQIEKGIADGVDYSIISDRREAIKEAVKVAEKGDTVIIAGKGHEDYQIVGTSRTHFKDKEVVREALSDLGY